MSLDALQSLMSEDSQRESELFRRQRERWLVGWVCYLMAITQYLIIGLVTSRDRALDVLSEFDRAVAQRRNELIEEFKLEGNLPKDFDAPSPAAAEISSESPVSPGAPPSPEAPPSIDPPPKSAPEEKPGPAK
jgi:hypothetical protein